MELKAGSLGRAIAFGGALKYFGMYIGFYNNGRKSRGVKEMRWKTCKRRHSDDDHIRTCRRRHDLAKGRQDLRHSSQQLASCRSWKVAFQRYPIIVYDGNRSSILSLLVTSENLLEVGIEDEVCWAALEARLSPVALVIFPDTKSSYSLNIFITCISCWHQ